MAERRCIHCEPGQPLLRKTIEEVEVDYCERCGGIWLDKGEIRKLALVAEAALRAVEELESSKAGGHPFRSFPVALADEAQRSGRRELDAPCPGCGGKLTLAIFGPSEIELCSSCDGIFVERGELEKAMELVDGASDATTIAALSRSVITKGIIGGD